MAMAMWVDSVGHSLEKTALIILERKAKPTRQVFYRWAEAMAHDGHFYPPID